MPNLKPYYQVKLTLLRCKLSFLKNPPKNEDEQYAYGIIQKAYEINEKKIEMLNFDKSQPPVKRVVCTRAKSPILPASGSSRWLSYTQAYCLCHFCRP